MSAGHEAAARRSWEIMRGLVLDHDRRKDVSDALGMSFLKAKALRALTQEPATLRVLAATLAVDAPYATIIVDDLEGRGLVTRTVHPEDRRARLVDLTPDGRVAAATADRMLSEPPAVLRELDSGRLRALEALLSALVAD
ncbi:MAG: MarR family transcriptional regulator [Solirubrobacterales bacterium]|nr:MarR family transcriptional regulator [Solirubrobacterales bacterium]